MMRRRSPKKGTPGVPVAPRDNGLPPKPTDLDDAKASLLQLFGVPVNVATGFAVDGGWGLFVFTDDAKLKLPDKHAGYRVHRRGVPKVGPLTNKRSSRNAP
jgi:hypothetical protein